MRRLCGGVRGLTRRELFAVSLGLTLALATPACGQSETRAQRPSLAELVRSLSEPGGYFDTDNLISNESAYPQVVERLGPVGGAYIGVGPEQNFTYIARTRPRWAFIVDVRRDNLLQQLLLNAILAHAPTPYDYLCWLFSRPMRQDARLERSAELDAVIAAFEATSPAEATLEANLERLLRHVGELGVELDPHDRATMRAIQRAFFRDQLDIRFRSHGQPLRRHHPTYRSLLSARTPEGAPAHFLASPEGYAHVRTLATAGRLVPVVGDFGGRHALRAVGRFLRQQGESVTSIYTSNVEFYLFESGTFGAWVENVRSLPIAEESLFIRAHFSYGRSHPERLRGHRSTVLLQPIPRFLELYDAGALRSYWEVCTLDYVR